MIAATKCEVFSVSANYAMPNNVAARLPIYASQSQHQRFDSVKFSAVNQAPQALSRCDVSVFAEIFGAILAESSRVSSCSSEIEKVLMAVDDCDFLGQKLPF